MTRLAARWSLVIMIMALTVLPGSSRAEAQACALTPTSGTVARTITMPEGRRQYRLRVPQGLTGSSAMLVISLHPYLANMQWQETNSGLSRAADRYKFIVAYPQGRWNPAPTIPGSGWDYLRATNNRDIDFLRAVVTDISRTYCVNAQQVHTEGFSLGAAMSQRMACAAPDVFASSMSHATNGLEEDFPLGGTPDPCRPSQPISLFLSCTERDDFGATDCVPQRDAWVSRLGCSDPPLAGGDQDDQYGWFDVTTPCDGGTEIWRRVWADLGHNYPTGAALDRYHAELVEFSRTHSFS